MKEQETKKAPEYTDAEILAMLARIYGCGTAKRGSRVG